MIEEIHHIPSEHLGYWFSKEATVIVDHDSIVIQKEGRGGDEIYLSYNQAKALLQILYKMGLDKNGE